MTADSFKYYRNILHQGNLPPCITGHEIFPELKNLDAFFNFKFRFCATVRKAQTGGQGR